MTSEPMIEHVERQEIEQYRSISILAIFALLGGIASLTCLAHPVMFFMPVVTVILSVMALRRINRSDGGLTGRGIALIGLGIALVALSTAIMRDVVATEIQKRQARQAADRWLDMLRAGNQQLAHQWTLSALLRQPRHASLAEAYADEERASALKTFFGKEPAKTLVELAGDAEFEYQRTRGVSGEKMRRYFMLEYAIRAPQHEDDGRRFLVLVLRRFDSEYKINWWQISSLQWPEEAAS